MCSRVVSSACLYLYLYHLTSWAPNFTIRRTTDSFVLKCLHACMQSFEWCCSLSQVKCWLELFVCFCCFCFHALSDKMWVSLSFIRILAKVTNVSTRPVKMWLIFTVLGWYDRPKLCLNLSLLKFLSFWEAWWLWAQRASNRACPLYCLVCMPWPGLPVCPSLQSLCSSSVL